MKYIQYNCKIEVKPIFVNFRHFWLLPLTATLTPFGNSVPSPLCAYVIHGSSHSKKITFTNGYLLPFQLFHNRRNGFWWIMPENIENFWHFDTNSFLSACNWAQCIFFWLQSVLKLVVKIDWVQCKYFKTENIQFFAVSHYPLYSHYTFYI